jgi:hypothetical protein
MPTDTQSIVAELASLRDAVTALQTSLASTQASLSEARDIQAVQRLLNHYTALHDDACFDLAKRAEWESLFCADGVAVYPYGRHVGRAGKGAWAFGGVAYFERCQLLSSNFDIEFSPGRRRAYVRTNCIAQWMRRKEVFDDHFDEGGFYQWILRKEADGQWGIERVELTITWTTGEDPTGVGPRTKVLEKL